MANNKTGIKFWRGAEPSNPAEGYVWFNPDAGSIALYKSSNWEYYGGIKNATYDNKILTITPFKGTAVTVNLSDMASAATLSTLSGTVGTLQTNYNTLSSEFETVKTTANTTSTAVAKIINQLKDIAEEEKAVKTYVDNKMSAHETARQTIDAEFDRRLDELEATTATHTGDVNGLKTFVNYAGGVNVPTQITNAINDLGATVGSTSFNQNTNTAKTTAHVAVEVIESNGKLTKLTVAENDIASAQALADLTTTVTNNKSNLEAAIATEKGRIDTLYGVTQTSTGDTGKSVRTIAAEEVAKIVDDNDSSDLDTLKEIAAWIQDHPEDAGEMNEQIKANTAAIATVNTRIDNLDYADNAVAKQYVSEVDQTNGVISVKRANLLDVCDEKGAAETAESNAKGYTDTLANGRVANAESAIKANADAIADLEDSVAAINTAIEENELTIASAITDLDSRLTALAGSAISSVTGQGYISASTTDGAVTIVANTGTMSQGGDKLAVVSDVKAYVDDAWTWGEF